VSVVRACGFRPGTMRCLSPAPRRNRKHWVGRSLALGRPSLLTLASVPESTTTLTRASVPNGRG
jgi:hypothetical protein